MARGRCQRETQMISLDPSKTNLLNQDSQHAQCEGTHSGDEEAEEGGRNIHEIDLE